MAQGIQQGTNCLPTIEYYAKSACANATGVVSAGYQTCTSYTVNTTTATLQIAVTGANINTSYQIVLTPQTCEYPTFNDTYLPILGAAIPTLALIWIGRKLYSIFGTETNV